MDDFYLQGYIKANVYKEKPENNINTKNSTLKTRLNKLTKAL